MATDAMSTDVTAATEDDDEEAQNLLADAVEEDGQQSEEDKDWKAEFLAQQRINRDLERKNKRNFSELQRLKQTAESAPATEPDLEALRQQARDEARNEALRERALDKIEAKAARLFANPEDARTFLANRVDDFIDGQSVDVQAITDALDDLLEQRPYLKVTQGDEKRYKGSADSGVRGSTVPAQLTRNDVERLTKEGKFEEIEKARLSGRLNTLLGIS